MQKKQPAKKLNGTKKVLLETFPEDLQAMAKKRAIDERVSFRDLVYRAVREYCAKPAR